MNYKCPLRTGELRLDNHTRDYFTNIIFLRLTWSLAGKYALISVLCLFRRVRWYVGN